MKKITTYIAFAVFTGSLSMALPSYGTAPGMKKPVKTTARPRLTPSQKKLPAPLVLVPVTSLKSAADLLTGGKQKTWVSISVAGKDKEIPCRVTSTYNADGSYTQVVQNTETSAQWKLDDSKSRIILSGNQSAGQTQASASETEILKLSDTEMVLRCKNPIPGAPDEYVTVTLVPLSDNMKN